MKLKKLQYSYLTKIFHYDYDGLTMKLSAARHSQKGFTLIELLVVIGILGILAAALVATIDPFEQLRKARDSRAQNVAVELQNALLRYYTVHEAMPWEGTAPACDMGGLNVAAGTTVEDLNTAPADCLDDLISQGELKQAFTTAQGLDQIFVVEPYMIDAVNSAVDGSPAICYIPQSKAGKADENTRYAEDGSIDPACPNAANPNAACYWCAE